MVRHVMAGALNIYCGLAGKNAQAVSRTDRGRRLLLPPGRGVLEAKKLVIAAEKGRIVSDWGWFFFLIKKRKMLLR